MTAHVLRNRQWQRAFRIRHFGEDRGAIRKAKHNAKIRKAARLFEQRITMDKIAAKLGVTRMWLWRNGFRKRQHATPKAA